MEHRSDPAVSDGRDDTVWDRDAWDLEPDSVALALRVMSPRTAGVIMREAFFGTRRFEDFLRHVDVSSGVLSARLRELVDEGMLEKCPYREPGARVRDEYRLTDKGRSMLPVLVALIDWADHWLVGPQGPTVQLLHRDCGAPITASVTCASGHSITAPRNVIAAPGPGARPAAVDSD
ncbi:helix-turn-helix domain-containing protein [Streptomyces sp. DT2A-34]|uniref:winged helix-turn-helix transcriptional regulator n=1 Tax=Streptomyces sp. DT2A-34 TaxID=3051182 RepID=UPI00265C371D|nr:helix-turn-helix domain-containing protein [Streptomyces sp. DT2A-34]MDO0916647.1 helix-turn-helix domain-containing protein [Streptomyces sp. DT2A-34]